MKWNKELLLKVKEQILKEPRQFVMCQFFYTSPLTIPNCGTAACIAGWCCALNSNKTPEETNKEIYYAHTPAAHALKLPFQLLDSLFYSEKWPFDLWQDFEKAENQNNHMLMAEIAAERIDQFIEEIDKL